MKLVPETSKVPVSQKPNDRLEKLEKEVANLSYALRISQVLLKQVLEQLTPTQQDLKATTGMMNDYQYRALAMQALLNVDVAALKTKADELKLVDYTAASDQNDVESGFTTADTVTSDQDVVIITSTVPGKEDSGIFRSKTVLADTGNPELIAGFMNRPVGTAVSAKIGENVHTVTLLGVRKQPVTPEATTTTETVQ
jgi:hypothetical protein